MDNRLCCVPNPQKRRIIERLHCGKQLHFGRDYLSLAGGFGEDEAWACG
jgi:hypothetical protein